MPGVMDEWGGRAGPVATAKDEDGRAGPVAKAIGPEVEGLVAVDECG
jgi:hypothetical protein